MQYCSDLQSNLNFKGQGYWTCEKSLFRLYILQLASSGSYLLNIKSALGYRVCSLPEPSFQVRGEGQSISLRNPNLDHDFFPLGLILPKDCVQVKDLKSEVKDKLNHFHPSLRQLTSQRFIHELYIEQSYRIYSHFDIAYFFPVWLVYFLTCASCCLSLSSHFLDLSN